MTRRRRSDGSSRLRWARWRWARWRWAAIGALGADGHPVIADDDGLAGDLRVLICGNVTCSAHPIRVGR